MGDAAGDEPPLDRRVVHDASVGASARCVGHWAANVVCVPPEGWLEAATGPAVCMHSMARILVTEEIAESGLQRLAAAGHTVDVQLGLSRDELLAAVARRRRR